MSGRRICDLTFSSKIRKRKETQLRKQTQLIPWPGGCTMKGEAKATGSPGGPQAHRVFGDQSAQILRRKPWGSRKGECSLCSELRRTRDTCSPSVTSAVPAAGGRCEKVAGATLHPLKGGHRQGGRAGPQAGGRLPVWTFLGY